MMYTVKKLMFSAFSSTLLFIHIRKHYYYACFRKWRTAMLKIKNLGYNSTHTHGINMERPNGMGHYLMLLLKSAAYIEVSEKAIC